ncbi:Elongator complex protein 2 [Penicillium macrosclerotiorum]|uniref:Elongator complex protein 2 n=1 Tax=Penicillium macrosclerotiorum TaxID=303699 RepID=UPI002546659F|nr:Elongator complex protein 2 [Penicillium macrosclerotiorum]KAJ5675914.1 Elongator complex protein 2 [Penicillium macrosclerotiorum]
MASVTTDYISVGGNRHPGAADWDVQSGVLAFGADNNVALWEPLDDSSRGVYALLVGHTDKVSVVRFYTCPSSGTRFLLTGSVDRTIRVWQQDSRNIRNYTQVSCLEGHQGSVNAIAVADGTDVVASGAADGTVRIWRINQRDGVNCELLESITMTPRFFPLTLSLRVLDVNNGKPLVLAVAGTTTAVQIFVAETSTSQPNFQRRTVLTGHEAWIRSLSFTLDKQSKTNDILLASASQDKYIRLWRLCRGEAKKPAQIDESDPLLGGMEPTLSNKAHEFEAGGSKYSITFEALLFGNEDWIYTTAWNPDPTRSQLLSASADNTVTIWEQDPVSSVWMSVERMGEISVQKGSTTATGSAGGFWIGLWSPDGKQVVSLGRTGSWRVWKHDSEAEIWVQKFGISGHVRSANGVQWEPNGGYLLSTSADQTSRLHAQWVRDNKHSWHEFSRPQIHGYDLNCIDTLGPAQFVSGADEKLLRVFNEPKQIAELLGRLSGFQQKIEGDLPDTAEIPVLGLSNKAQGDEAPVEEQVSTEAVSSTPAASLITDTPPLEDQLSRYTLWPEHEKLYGHGYEISAVAVSHDRTLIATACKASSIDHAVIRLYDTSDWHEIKPSLTAHSLTITDLSFSDDDKYLLSVSRDRQWAVFARSDEEPTTFINFTTNPKGHSRMILGAAWAPNKTERIFATAGRDKSVKIWQKTDNTFTCKSIVALTSAVSAIAFLPSPYKNSFILAAGEDSGSVSVHGIAVDSLEAQHIVTIDQSIAPSRAITQLSWRPVSPTEVENRDCFELAVASEDTSTRIYAISNILS